MGRKKKNKPAAARQTRPMPDNAPAAPAPIPATRGGTAATVALLLAVAVVVAVVLGALENVKAAVLENCGGCFKPALNRQLEIKNSP